MLADMVEEYNSLQDDIHINATFVSRTELMNQYTVGALSGELPDIGQVDSPDMESYISLGVFEDITDDLESWGELDQFYDGPLSSCKDPDGKVYGLPQNSNCLALACNMDLLKAAGYDHMPLVLMSSRKWLQQQQMHPMMYTDSQCVQYLQKKEHSRSFHG